jgi:hypothetical protein
VLIPEASSLHRARREGGEADTEGRRDRALAVHQERRMQEAARRANWDLLGNI